jgi:hypothetical protein
LAIGYVIFRGALETATYVAVALCWLLLVTDARQYEESADGHAAAFSSLGTVLAKAMDPIIAVQDVVVGIGALMLYYVLYEVRLLPRWLSGWGLFGAVLYATVGLIAVFGADVLGATMVMPLLVLAVQEMVMAFWLIAKGFGPGLNRQADGSSRKARVTAADSGELNRL